MSLYKMELYRILHGKMVRIFFVVMLVWLGLYFGFGIVAQEHSTVDGTTYYGCHAIKIDREITEEFKGALTDNAAAGIVVRYGFPHEVREGYGGWQDENYLNGFVASYLSDGYFSDWNDYKAAESIVSLKDSALSPYAQEQGGSVDFAYAKGWEYFLEMSQMAGWFLSVWLIITLSPIFCEEKQNKMRPLVFTTQKGQNTDVAARISAAFTVAAFSYLALIFLLLVLCKIVFGFDGGNMKSGIVLTIYEHCSFSHWDVKSFTGLYLVTGFCAILMLTAVIIWVSARAETVVRSMLACTLIWVLPVVLLLTFGGRALYLFAVTQPLFLTNYTCLAETGGIYFVRVAVAAAVVVSGVLCGFRCWRKVDAE